MSAFSLNEKENFKCKFSSRRICCLFLRIYQNIYGFSIFDFENDFLHTVYLRMVFSISKTVKKM